MKVSRVLAARDGRRIVGTLTWQSKKPSAIDVAHFTPCQKALYLINMAVIRLDAYATAAGAGEFYRKCGYVSAGGKSYRGVPLSYFELITGGHV